MQHTVSDLPAILTDYAQVMASAPTADEVLDRLGRYCTELLPVDGVGVLLRDDDAGGLSVATASTEVGRIIEELEAELREGPCSDALRFGVVQAAPDLAAAREQYPRFVPRAVEAGVRAVHGVPMAAPSGTLGALDLINLEVRHLGEEELAAAQMLGDVTSAYVTNARVLGASQALATQLQRALDTRVVLEQAKGVLKERHDIPIAEAFDRLRGHARRNRQPIREVAEAVLDGGLDV